MNPELYLHVRRKEGRLYPDDMVACLPEVPPHHPLRTEWHMRAASARRLTAYLAALQRPITVLELGCGNGWLSNCVARNPNARVTGMERNSLELIQAARVFAGNARLSWVEADIFRVPFPERRFDAIVMAAAIQYFPNLDQLIELLLNLLTPGGEIHILDSPFYSEEALPAARERSRKYYETLGYPEMAAHYHHHLLPTLEVYHPVTRYSPVPGSGDSPFPWICLQQADLSTHLRM